MSANNNDPITIDYNIVQRARSQKQKDFASRALEINLEEHRTFSLKDFPDFTKGNFRTMILKLRKLGLIELYVRSNMGHYKVKGVEMPLDFRRVTFEGMGVGLNMMPILRMLRHQPPSIHDIRLQFSSKKIHQYLKRIHYPVNPSNHGVILERSLGDNIRAKIHIYPNTVQIDLACTYKPFVYDMGSAIALVNYMGRLHEFLLWVTNRIADDIPDPMKWVVTHYHFAKDGQGYSGEKFERTFEDFAGGFVRFYTKTMLDGKVIPRLEILYSPKNTLDEQIDLMINEELAASDMLQ